MHSTDLMCQECKKKIGHLVKVDGLFGEKQKILCNECSKNYWHHGYTINVVNENSRKKFR